VVYGATASLGSAVFAAMAAHVALRTTGDDDAMLPEKRLFKYSILYLFILFGAVALDRGLA
jgi:protoheme IX farnesyltransferase